MGNALIRISLTYTPFCCLGLFSKLSLALVDLWGGFASFRPLSLPLSCFILFLFRHIFFSFFWALSTSNLYGDTRISISNPLDTPSLLSDLFGFSFTLSTRHGVYPAEPSILPHIGQHPLEVGRSIGERWSAEKCQVDWRAFAPQPYKDRLLTIWIGPTRNRFIPSYPHSPCQSMGLWPLCSPRRCWQTSPNSAVARLPYSLARPFGCHYIRLLDWLRMCP